MTMRVGGVSVNFTVDTREAKNRLDSFVKSMSDIRLEGVIKGNPFQTTVSYMKEAKRELNSVFKSWRDNIHDVEAPLNNLAEKARVNTEKIIRSFQQLSEQYTAVSKKEKVLSFKEGGAGYGVDFKATSGINISELQKRLGELKGISANIDKTIDAIINSINNKKISTETALRSMFKILEGEIEKAAPGIVEKYRGFGVELSKAFNIHVGLQAGIDFKNAKDISLAIKDRVALTKELIIKETELRRNAEAGIQTDQLQVNLIKLYNKYKEKGAFLDGSRKEAIAQYALAQERSRLATESLNNKEKERTQILKELTKVRENAAKEARVAEEEELKRKAKILEDQIKEEKRVQKELLKIQEEADKERTRLDIERQKKWDTLIKKQEDYAKKRATTLYGTSEAPRELPRLATAESQVFRTQSDLILNIRKQLEIATVAMEKGFNIEKNREIVLRSINALKQAGVTLKQKELDLEKRTATVQNALSYGVQLRQAGDLNLAYKKRLDITKELKVRELQLRTEAKAGIGVDTLRTNLMGILNEKRKLGIKLTEQERQELAAYNLEQKKAPEDRGFLSAAWFKQRAGWFLQLRGFWALYRAVGSAARDLVEYETQLSRALRTARSETKSTAEITKEYAKALQDAAGIHGSSWKDLGEALYQLGSAGLSAEEAIAALNSTMSLIVGTEGDVRETTKAVAGVYNNFKDTLTEFNTAQEKFNYINNLVAAAWRDHQVEVNELTDGYNRASAVAKVVGVSLKDLTTILAVANDHMIKGGQAGRALVAVWSRMSKDSEKFKDVFQLDIDTSKPLKFMNIMEQLNKRFKDGVLTVGQLGDMFDRLGLRGAPIFATLIKSWDDVIASGKKFNNIQDAYAEIEKKRLDNLSGQWNKLIRHMAAAVTKGKILYDLAEGILKKLNEVSEGETDKFIQRLYKVNLHKDINKASKSIENINKELVILKERYKETGNSNDFIRIKGLELELTRWKKFLKDREDSLRKSQEILKEVYKVPGEKKETGGLSHEERRLQEIRKRQYQEYKFSEEEKLNRLELLEDPKANKKALEAELKAAKDRAKLYKDQADELKKLGKATSGEYKKAREQQELVLKLQGQLKAVISQINSEQKAQLELQKEQEETQIKIIDFKIKQLSIGDRTEKKEKDINKLLTQKLIHQNKANDLQFKINIIGKDTKVNAEDLLKLSKDQNIEEDKLNKSTNTRAALQTKLNELIREANKNLDIQKQEIEIAKINHATKSKIAELEGESLISQKKYLQNRLELEKTNKDIEERRRQIATIEGEIRDINLDIVKNQEKQNGLNSITYDWIQRLKDNTKEWHDVATDALVTFSEGLAIGTAGVFTDLTGGFQEQQQEVENLKGELAELGQEYKDAVSEGDIERTEQLTSQMAELRNQIEDLEDPLNNIKEEFKDFFKDLIDGIRKAINEWIAMQIVMGILKSVVPNPAMVNGSPTEYYGTGFEGQYGTGGVLSNIKSFRTFSSGGITNRPTLAVLGDNASKKELVIPTENIQSNNVSGYMRDSGNQVTVINLLTKEDIYSIMSETQGQRVILNPIGKDLREGGPLSKIIKG